MLTPVLGPVVATLRASVGPLAVPLRAPVNLPVRVGVRTSRRACPRLAMETLPARGGSCMPVGIGGLFSQRVHDVSQEDFPVCGSEPWDRWDNDLAQLPIPVRSACNAPILPGQIQE